MTTLKQINQAHLTEILSRAQKRFNCAWPDSERRSQGMKYVEQRLTGHAQGPKPRSSTRVQHRLNQLNWRAEDERMLKLLDLDNWE